MTQENEIKRPTQDLEHEPIKQLDNSEKGGKVSQALETVTTTAEKVQRQPVIAHLIRGTFLAAIGFEVIKIVMTYTLPSLMKSPSGAAFGSVLGLMAFFYFFARLTLFCAAWIATAEYKDDPRMPGKTQP